MNTAEINTDITAFVFTTNFLDEWLGHRRLTRKVIAAFPEDKLFTYSIGGMRPFAEMVKELIDVSGPGVRGIARKSTQQGCPSATLGRINRGNHQILLTDFAGKIGRNSIGLWSV
jgi:hypothetical protein